MHIPVVFPDVQDSPLFRGKVRELETNVEALRERAAKLIKGAKKYKDGLEDAYQSTLAFATCLEEFCGGTDEESGLLGGPLLTKFVGSFRELASFHELLRTQVELILCERLNHHWTLLTGEAKECKKKLDRRSADYDSARLKHLGHKNVGGWSSSSKHPDKTMQDLTLAKSAAEEARFELARKLTEVEGRKRYDFLEALVSSMDAHVRFFERGSQMLAGLGPYIQHSLEVVELLKNEAAGSMASLEEAITQHRHTESARDSLLQEAATTGAGAAAVSGALAATKGGGPLQMTDAGMQHSHWVDGGCERASTSVLVRA
ncbi:hypothetical protein N2152v2_006679 [Parachlorella kessleri]